MIKVNVAITSISAERFWDFGKPVPPIQIGTNINMVNIDKKTDDTLKVPFVLTINYHPAIAQINIKGSAYVTGDSTELEKVAKDYEDRKPPPPVIVQAISNVVFVESVILSRTLNIPPPIPLPKIPQAKPQKSKPKGRDYSA